MIASSIPPRDPGRPILQSRSSLDPDLPSEHPLLPLRARWAASARSQWSSATVCSCPALRGHSCGRHGQRLAGRVHHEAAGHLAALLPPATAVDLVRCT